MTVLKGRGGASDLTQDCARVSGGLGLLPLGWLPNRYTRKDADTISVVGHVPAIFGQLERPKLSSRSCRDLCLRDLRGKVKRQALVNVLSSNVLA
jgi:hypothetical protein